MSGFLHAVRSAIARHRAMRTFASAPVRPSQWGMAADADGHLRIGGLDAAALADQYGTPLHVVDAELLRNAFARFTAAFGRQGLRCETFFSYKTNPIPAVHRVLHESGAGAEVTSPFELWLALESGVGPERILYNGPGKDAASLRLAIEHGIRRIHVNSLEELDRIEAIAEDLDKAPRIGIRLFTGVGWGGQFGFGLASGEAQDALERLAASRNTRFDAVHAHIGSIIQTATPYEGAIAALIRFLSTARKQFGLAVPTVDLGGGFSVPTVRSLDRTDRWLQRLVRLPVAPRTTTRADSLDVIAERVANVLRSSCARHDVDVPTLELEPGRTLTSSAQVLLTRVKEIRSGGRRPEIAVLDAGVGQAAPVQWEVHDVIHATRLHESRSTAYRLVGPVVTPADVISSCTHLPRLAVGDLLAVMDSGAYLQSLENSFCFPRSATVMADDGGHQVVRSRETFEQVVARDRLPWE